MNPLEKEEKVRRILEKQSKCKLIKTQLSIGRKSNGSHIFHEFDIVSVNKKLEFDGNVVGEIKSDKFGNENGYRTTRFPRMIKECFYLQKVKSKRKMLIFTEKGFWERFTKDVDGLISDIGIGFVDLAFGKLYLKDYYVRKRNWLIEDNLVALYIALHKYKDIKYNLREIKNIISHKGFTMRVQQYLSIHTKGKRGLTAGLKSPTFKELHSIFVKLDRRLFASLVNLILEVKLKIK